MLKKLKNYLKNKDLIDVILFGSAIKGKTKPKDIDICLIFREKIDRSLINNINQKFENIHVSTLTVDNFFTKPHALIRTLLFEGKSLFSNRPLSKIYGLESLALYTYDISVMKSSDKVRFVYLLKGRNKEKGLIESLGGKFISTGTFIIPSSKDKEVQEVLEKWKIKYERKKIMLIH